MYFSQVSECSKWGIEEVRKSSFAVTISSQDFVSFVFLFLDHTDASVFICLLDLDHVTSKPYLLESKKLQLNVSCGSGIKKDLEIEELTDAAELLRCSFRKLNLT